MSTHPNQPTPDSSTVRNLTTVVLEERPDGGWVATQTDIPVEGRGETAAEAATNYCRQIDGRARDDA
ncbi:hypothetical protein ACFQGE_13995 [Halomicroarcula sp. GCM10025817]|uniref:hypothetical protein n=1 Tax=Haloarcula TaxID=2237 RepID=UPI0023E75ADB|nr:hypothetical protein [Halomicroarcula sp. SYNS111]